MERPVRSIVNMPCPFFEPALDPPPEPWQQRWTHRPRLPLGDCYSGLCHAAEPRAVTGPERDLCNHGYARGRCAYFPESCQADAVRFSMVSEDPPRLIYILEKDYAPLEHGEVLPPGPIPAAQARAFLAAKTRDSILIPQF